MARTMQLDKIINYKLYLSSLEKLREEKLKDIEIGITVADNVDYDNDSDDNDDDDVPIYVPIINETLGQITWNLFSPISDNTNIVHKITKTLNDHPDVIGLVDDETGEQISFLEMLNNSVLCAQYLDDNDFHDTIPICSRNHIDAYVPFLAILYIGAIANPLDDIFYKEDAFIRHIRETEPAVIFVDTYYFHFVLYVISTLENCNTRIIRLSRDSGDLFPTLRDILTDEYYSDSDFVTRTPVEQYAAKLFFPGTVDAPTKVAILHAVFLASSTQQAPNMRTGDVSLWLESLAFSTGLLLTVHAILLRATVIKIKTDTFEIQEMAEIINKHKVTWVFLETSLCMQMIKNVDITQCASLKTLVYGGSADYQNYLGKYLSTVLPDVSILEIYNTTQVGAIICQQHIKKRKFVKCISKNILMKIVSPEECRGVHEENFGEIIYITPYSEYCRDGYIKYVRRDIKTCTKYAQIKHIKMKHKQILRDTSKVWNFSGDYGYYTKKGNIYVESRMSDLFTYRNLTISASEIEYYLRIHPIVNDVAVVIVPRIINTEDVVIAFFSLSIKVTKWSPINILTNIINYQFSCIKYFWPFCMNLPRLSNGKIHRRKLREYAEILINEKQDEERKRKGENILNYLSIGCEVTI